MKTRIYDVTLVTPSQLYPHSAIDVEDGKIVAVYKKSLPENEAGIQIIDGAGCYAAPGFVDIHVHGGGGVNFSIAETPEDIRRGCAAHAQYGTTTILPTCSTAKVSNMVKMIENTRQAQKITTECTIAGVHLEGPFFSLAQAGAQDPATIIDPSVEALDQFVAAWPGGIRIMGVAPERPGGVEFGKELTKRGIRASIAHSDADYSVCVDAMNNGYSDVTHIYSGCSIVHRVNAYRTGGVVEAGLLEDGLTVQVIADGKHLPPELLRLIVKCKGVDKISTITDALFPAATDMPEGSVVRQENGAIIVLEDGVMKMEDRQAFAGSIATTDRLVRNMVELAGVSVCDAVRMMTANPARVAGIDDRKGYLKPSYDADIVLLTKDLQVKSVMAMGNIIK